jgi:hypothetical protein
MSKLSIIINNDGIKFDEREDKAFCAFRKLTKDQLKKDAGDSRKDDGIE